MYFGLKLFTDPTGGGYFFKRGRGCAKPRPQPRASKSDFFNFRHFYPNAPKCQKYENQFFEIAELWPKTAQKREKNNVKTYKSYGKSSIF